MPWASGVSPAASAAAAPPLDPPGVRSRFHGFRVAPFSSDSVKATVPNSGVFVFPRITKPASRSRRTTAVSKSGMLSANARLEYVVRIPAVGVEVLHSDRDATERSRFAGGIGRLRVGDRLFATNGDEGVHLGIDPCDPLQIDFRELDRGNLPVADEACLLGRGKERELRRGDRFGNGAAQSAILRLVAGECQRSGEGRNRTGDTTVFSRVLYRLSYLARTLSLPALSVNQRSRPEAGFAGREANYGLMRRAQKEGLAGDPR